MKRYLTVAERRYEPMPSFTLKALLDECAVLVAQADYAVKATLYGADRTGPVPVIANLRDLPCARDICAVYHYAFNGYWAESLELALTWDTVESLERLTAIAEVALFIDNYKSGELLNRLNLVAIARARIDFPTSSNDRRFAIPDTEAGSLGYGDLALLSGISPLSLRNLVARRAASLTPQKAGREVWFHPEEAQTWLVKDRGYQKTHLVPDKKFWSGIERLLNESTREFH